MQARKLSKHGDGGMLLKLEVLQTKVHFINQMADTQMERHFAVGCPTGSSEASIDYV